MPYIAILGLPFLRVIIDWISQYIIHYKPYIRSYTNKGSHDPVLIQFKQRNNVIITVAWAKLHLHGHRLTVGDDPSCSNLPAVRPPDNPLHSMATGIARDKAMSTL